MKRIVNRVDRHLARRLLEARRETGKSTYSVVDDLPKRVAISHATLAAYERGESSPPIDVLAALADYYHRPLNWFLEARDSLEGLRYRNLPSRIGVKEKRQFEATAAKWVDAYFNLERHLGEKPNQSRMIASTDGVGPKQLAQSVREQLRIADDQPIVSVVDLLESFGTRVIELPTTLAIDGFAARHGDDSVVVLNPATNSERLRMNAGHELAHVLYDDCKTTGVVANDALEKRAYEFASCLLIPDTQLAEAFASKSFVTLLKYKQRFGISMAAMIYRAEKAKIIRSTLARRLWKDMSAKWGKNEPGSTTWLERADRFERMLDSAINNRRLTWDEAERVTGIRQDDLRERLKNATDTAFNDTQADEEESIDSPEILAFSRQ